MTRYSGRHDTDIRGELGQLNGRVDTLTLEMRSKFDLLAAGSSRP